MAPSGQCHHVQAVAKILSDLPVGALCFSSGSSTSVQRNKHREQIVALAMGIRRPSARARDIAAVIVSRALKRSTPA